MPEFTKKERRARELAGLALSAGLADDWPRATHAVQRIGDECGEVGLDIALQGWADTLLARMGHTRGAPVRIAFRCVDGGDGQIQDADQVARPEVVWAGRMLAARAADDEATWRALEEALPEKGHEVGLHVAALLEMCVLMLGRIGGREARRG